MPPAAAPIVPLDAEAQQRLATSIDLVHWVLERWFWNWKPRFDELLGVGVEALCIAARDFREDRGHWSSYAVKSIWGRVSTYLEKHLQPWIEVQWHKPQLPTRRAWPREHWEPLMLPRDIPASRNWACVSCNRPIDWDAERDKPGGVRAHVTHGLCAPCVRRRYRMRRRGCGEGVCARCASVLRSRQVFHNRGRGGGLRDRFHLETYCRCDPEPPALTWEER